MAPPPGAAVLRALLLVLALSFINFSECQTVRGSVSCLDCTLDHDLSGVRVAVGCSNEKSIVYALTNVKGYFEAKIPTNSSSPPSSRSVDCLAKLLGGSVQLYSFKKSMVSKITKLRGSSDSYALATPLSCFFSWPTESQHQKLDNSSPMFGPSKPVNNVPPPTDWNLPAPLIYFFPFIPIIGIP